MFSDPNIDETIQLNGKVYRFSEASSAPGIVYAEIGRKAKIYRLIDNKNDAFALKVFKEAYRSSNIRETTIQITTYQDIVGLAVAQRVVIDPKKHSAVIRQHKDFTYAVLMPWIEGKSWINFVAGKIRITRHQSWLLVQTLANTMARLEQYNLAHCDLSSSNFIFSPDFSSVELIDIEDMFGPNLIPPRDYPKGTNGYGPPWIQSKGIWEATADRFSAAILISEILGWQFKDVRGASHGDTFFAEAEFGNESRRFRLLSSRLKHIYPPLSRLFETVWFAQSLEDCPKIEDWQEMLTVSKDMIIEQRQRKPRKPRQPRHSIQAITKGAESDFDRSSRTWWGLIYFIMVISGFALFLATLMALG